MASRATMTRRLKLADAFSSGVAVWPQLLLCSALILPQRALILRRGVVKKILIAGAAFVALTGIPAFAADMALKAPPPPPPPVYSWTGFYIGANVGGGWGSNRSVDYSSNVPHDSLFMTAGETPVSTSFKDSGALGGLQLGFNWQFNRIWLVGLETDFDWSGLKGSGSGTGTVPFTAIPVVATVDEQIEWFGTVRSRLGYLPMNNFLTYITGGFAYGRVDHTGSYVNNGITGFGGGGVGFGFFCNPGTCFTGSSSGVATGWTAGAGFEYAVSTSVTLKAEYLYVSLSSKSITETATTSGGGGLMLSSFNANYSNTNFNVARVGFNYRL
jgi:outer membrane immunogenic protein